MAPIQAANPTRRRSTRPRRRLPGSLAQTYSGSALAATATTTPSGLTVTYSYVGTSGTTYGPSATAPTAAGSYTVTGDGQRRELRGLGDRARW